MGYADVRRIGGWDAYVFTASEFQCVSGGPYVILVHKEAQVDKTVMWLEVGDECWPEHEMCGGEPSALSGEEGLRELAAGVDISPFGPTPSTIITARWTA